MATKTPGIALGNPWQPKGVAEASLAKVMVLLCNVFHARRTRRRLSSRGSDGRACDGHGGPIPRLPTLLLAPMPNLSCLCLHAAPVCLVTFSCRIIQQRLLLFAAATVHHPATAAVTVQIHPHQQVCTHPGLLQHSNTCPALPPAAQGRRDCSKGTGHAGCTSHSGLPRPITAGVHPSPTLLFALPLHLPAVILSEPPGCCCSSSASRAGGGASAHQLAHPLGDSSTTATTNGDASSSTASSALAWLAGPYMALPPPEPHQTGALTLA